MNSANAEDKGLNGIQGVRVDPWSELKSSRVGEEIFNSMG